MPFFNLACTSSCVLVSSLWWVHGVDILQSASSHVPAISMQDPEQLPVCEQMHRTDSVKYWRVSYYCQDHPLLICIPNCVRALQIRISCIFLPQSDLMTLVLQLPDSQCLLNYESLQARILSRKEADRVARISAREEADDVYDACFELSNHLLSTADACQVCYIDQTFILSVC